MTLATMLIDQHILSMLEQRALMQKGYLAEPSLSDLRTMRVGRMTGHSPQLSFLPGYLNHRVSNGRSKLFMPTVGAAPVATTSQQQTASLGSGVYFNNEEVQNEMHPSHQVHGVRFTSKVECLPVGKPMPQPPRLVWNEPVELTAAAAFEPATAEGGNDDQAEKRKLTLGDDDEGLNVRNNKRARTGVVVEPSSRPPVHHDSRKTLSQEQKSFIEAALALAESGLDESPKNSPALKPTTEPSIKKTRSSPVITATTKSPNSVLQALPPPPFFLAPQPLDLKDVSSSQQQKRGPNPRFI